MKNYNQTGWAKFARDFLIKYPKCDTCGEKATVCGHTIKANKYYEEFGLHLLDERLYRPRCRSCNRLDKTRNQV